MNGYDLSRLFWDYAFENPDKIRPNHCALYFFAVEHCNRLGWKTKFGLPTTMVMEAIGIKSYNTYINTFNDLVEYGFFILHEKSRNQYSSNVIEVSKINKANDKALDKALIKHGTKHIQSTEQSTDSIIKQVNNETINNIIYTAEIAFELFNKSSLNGRFFSKMMEIYSLPEHIVVEQFEKWKDLNVGESFSSEKHLRNSFNKWMRNFKPEKDIKPKKSYFEQDLSFLDLTDH